MNIDYIHMMDIWVKANFNWKLQIQSIYKIWGMETKKKKNTHSYDDEVFYCFSVLMGFISSCGDN